MLHNRTINTDTLAEMRLLALFNLASLQEGIKVHTSADEAEVAAVLRLHAKGLITQPDGGYLTDLGVEAAEHLQSVLSILHD